MADALDAAIVPPSGAVAEMQELALPNGTTSVADFSWNDGKDLMVLLRRVNDGKGNKALYQT